MGLNEPKQKLFEEL